jgi:Domain of unknown function (DUF4384)
MRKFLTSAAAFAAVSMLGVASGQEPQRIRVAVEKRDGTNWTAVNSAHVFEPGDHLRFRVSTTFGGYLYVTDQGTSGNYELLFPRSDTGSDNRIAANQDYIVPASQGVFKVSGPPGHDVIYWLVSPVDLGRQYRPLPRPPAPGSAPPSMHPRCDDAIFKSRGDCIDTQAGLRPVKPEDKLPDSMLGVVTATPRELLFIQDNSIGKESVVVSSPAPLSGPVVYELRLAHR